MESKTLKNVLESIKEWLLFVGKEHKAANPFEANKLQSQTLFNLWPPLK